MRPKFSFVLLLFLFNISAAFSQKISGEIMLPDGKPAEYAAVLLLRGQDSTLVKGAATDEKGNFELDGIEKGDYLISVSFVGYPKFMGQKFSFDGSNLRIETVKLAAQSTELAGVTVTVRKPLIEVKADRTIFNVESSVTAAGSNGLEILRKAPGVTLDNNENIQLKGKNGVEVYVDGKKSYMSQAELVNYLKSIPAADIEAIEIITNPSARFDASGNAGIINIRLKKNKNFGTNGSVNLALAHGISENWDTKDTGPKESISLSLNNRTKKVNTFGTVSVSDNTWYNNMNLRREQDGRVFDQRQQQVNDNRDLNGKFGLDYFPNSRHTFGVLFNGGTNLQQNKWTSDSRTTISNLSNPNKIDSILVAQNVIAGGRQNVNANFNYRFADTSGHEFVLDVDNGYYNATSNSTQPNTYRTGDDALNIRQNLVKNETPSNINIFTIKGDYNQTLGKESKLETGFKVANVKTDNQFDFFNVLNNVNVRDLSQSNEFLYTERVSAAYVNYNTNFKFKKIVADTAQKTKEITQTLGVQFGVRLENTYSIGDLRRDPSQLKLATDYVKRDYTNLFPSAAITFEPNQKHSFAITYSRRIDRPDYENLNPFEWRLDELTYRKGNPFLKPQYSNNFEFKYTLLQFISLSSGYNRTVDGIMDLVERDPLGTGRSYINYRNLAQQDNYNISLSSPTPIKKWWNGYLNVSVYQSIFTAKFPEYSFRLKSPWAVNFYGEQTFSLPKNTTLEVSGWFNSGSIWGGSWYNRPQGSFDIGVQKKVLEGRGSIKLSLSDLFFTAPWSAVGDAIPGFKVSAGGNWESRQVRLNFNYRFGGREVKGARSRETGSESESRRVKQG
ncbi:MAG: hypothetical protein RL757_1821 [Bacteroidota bacterium]